jgi:hypothetical protein
MNWTCKYFLLFIKVTHRSNESSGIIPHNQFCFH